VTRGAWLYPFSGLGAHALAVLYPASSVRHGRGPAGDRAPPTRGGVLALALRRCPLEALPTQAPLSFSVLRPRTPEQLTFESLLLRPTPPSPAQGSEYCRDNQCASEREPNLLLEVHWVTCSAELGAVREATAIGRIASELLASHAENSEKRVRPLLDQLEHALSAMPASGLRIV
jgi:hypothetical protein